MPAKRFVRAAARIVTSTYTVRLMCDVTKACSHRTHVLALFGVDVAVVAEARACVPVNSQGSRALTNMYVYVYMHILCCEVRKSRLNYDAASDMHRTCT